jgi:preprotein translocase subunit SecB
MEKNAKLQFKGHKIVKSEIVFNNDDVSPEISLEIERSSILKSTTEIEVTTKTKIIDNNNSVNIYVELIGYFVFDSDIDEMTKNIFTNVSAPAILFPYIRAYISTLTALSGRSPILLPTINLTNKEQ